MHKTTADRLIEVESLPLQDTGAPLPTVVSSDSQLLLAYIVSEPDPAWDGDPTSLSPATPDRQVAIVRFHLPFSHSFGPPNDEALDGHPLSSRGLKPYSWFEVRDSSWIQSLERMNSVHPRHRPDSFKAYRHYIATFHDSTFECVARGFDVQLHRGSVRSAVERMTELLGEGA